MCKNIVIWQKKKNALSHLICLYNMHTINHSVLICSSLQNSIDDLLDCFCLPSLKQKINIFSLPSLLLQLLFLGFHKHLEDTNKTDYFLRWFCEHRISEKRKNFILVFGQMTEYLSRFSNTYYFPMCSRI